jgi:protoporphyrinogen IX oxidase
MNDRALGDRVPVDQGPAHNQRHRLDGRAAISAEAGSELSETLKVMERRLLRAIMNPAMLASLLSGGLLLLDESRAAWSDGWLHAKLALVILLMAIHMMMGRWRRDFAEDRNSRPQKFFRIANEVPTVLMIGIVVLVIVRPF